MREKVVQHIANTGLYTVKFLKKLTNILYSKALILESVTFVLMELISFIHEKLNSKTSDYQVIVKSAKDLKNIDSEKSYFIDGKITIKESIIIPPEGITINGYSFNLSKIITEDDIPIFTSPIEGSGDLIMQNIALEATGSGSSVYDLTGATGGEAIEIESVNFNNCSSLGEYTNYLQYLETGTGRFGGTPELTISGSGMRISTSIVRGISNITALFRQGTSLSFSGRFITDINCNLNTTGALLNFVESNFINDESLEINNAFITRNGIIDSSDTTIIPNITERNIKSLWSNNTGIPNTQKYIKADITTEVTTIISSQGSYVPLEGDFTVEANPSHFSMPTNGEFKLLTGSGKYQITGDFVIEGSPDDLIDIRITESQDDGSTWPVVVNQITRPINTFPGSRNVGFFPLNFLVTINKGDRIRLEVANESSMDDITAEIESYFIITQV